MAWNKWDAQEKKKISTEDEVRFIPAILLRDKVLHRTATKWYCGLWPKNPELPFKQPKSKRGTSTADAKGPDEQLKMAASTKEGGDGNFTNPQD